MADTLSKWVGGPLFHKIRRGSSTGGVNNGRPMGRRKTRFHPCLMKALAQNYKSLGSRRK